MAELSENLLFRLSCSGTVFLIKVPFLPHIPWGSLDQKLLRSDQYAATISAWLF